MQRRDILVGGGGLAAGAVGWWAVNNGALDDVAGDASAAASGDELAAIDTGSLPGVDAFRYGIRDDLPGAVPTFATTVPDSVAMFDAGGNRVAAIDPTAGEDWLELSWPVAGQTAYQVQSIRGDARETIRLGTGMSISVSNAQYTDGRVTADVTYGGPAPVHVDLYQVRSRADIQNRESEALAAQSPLVPGDTFSIDVPWRARVADLFVELRQSRETATGSAVEKATASLSV
jgi:hypothetical protein